MSDQDEDPFAGGFASFTDNIKPGTSIGSWVGKMRYRQGNDPRDWSSCGGSTYLPRDWQMQCGAFMDMFTARKFGGFEVTFPVPFGDSPIVMCTTTGTLPGFEQIAQLQAVIQSSAVVEIYWWSVNNITRIYVNWFAFGPVGL